MNIKGVLKHNEDWLIEQRQHEIARLESVLRNPRATQTEIRIAMDMLKFTREGR